MPIRDFHQNNREWFETEFCRPYSIEDLNSFMIATWNRKGSTRTAKQHIVYRRHQWEPQSKFQHQICKCSLPKLSKSFNIGTWTLSEASEKQSSAALIGVFHQNNREWFEIEFCRAYSIKDLNIFMTETWTRKGSTTKAKQQIVYKRHQSEPERKKSASHLQV